jgi:hypothetical protein
VGTQRWWEIASRQCAADRQVLKNNTALLAKAAEVFKIVAPINSVGTESFAGYIYPRQLFLALGRGNAVPDADVANEYPTRGRGEGWDQGTPRQRCTARPRSSSSCFAAIRSAVPKPSVKRS